MRCMHARPQRRKDQLPLRSLRDLRSRSVFAPVRPRLAKWEYKQPKGPRGTSRNGGISEGQKHCNLRRKRFFVDLLLASTQ